MDISTHTQDAVNDIVKLMMEVHHESQTSIAKVLGTTQPQVGYRLRPSEDERGIDWKTGELDRLANHWHMPVALFFGDRATAYRWLAEHTIDLRGQAIPPLSCDSSTWVSEPSLFELEPFDLYARAS